MEMVVTNERAGLIGAKGSLEKKDGGVERSLLLDTVISIDISRIKSLLQPRGGRTQCHKVGSSNEEAMFENAPTMDGFTLQLQWGRCFSPPPSFPISYKPYEVHLHRRFSHLVTVRLPVCPSFLSAPVTLIYFSVLLQKTFLSAGFSVSIRPEIR